MWRAFLLLAIGVSLLVVRGAGAEVSPARAVQLVYTRGVGAEACPGETALRDAVSARLGYDPFRADGARRVRASIAREAAELVAIVELTAGDRVLGARRLASPATDCAELASAITLAITIAIDPIAGAAPAAASAPLPPPPPPPPPAAERAAPAAIPISWRASVGLLGTLGAAPSTTAGFTAGAGIRRGAFSLAVEGRVDLPASQTAPQGPGGGGGTVESSLVLATLVPCGHRSVYFGCALASAGALRGSGYNVATPRRDTTPFVAAGARIGVELPIANVLAVRLHGDLLATLTRTALDVGDRAVWSTPPLAGAFGAAVVGRFE